MTTIESGAASRIALVLAKLRASAASQATESETSREMKTNRVGGRSESRSVLSPDLDRDEAPVDGGSSGRERPTAPSFSNAVRERVAHHLAVLGVHEFGRRFVRCGPGRARRGGSACRGWLRGS